jgi:hypothetical protein
MPNLFGLKNMEALVRAARVERRSRILPTRQQVEHQIEALTNLIDIGQVNDLNRDRYRNRFAILAWRSQHFVLLADWDGRLSIQFRRHAADKYQADRRRDAYLKEFQVRVPQNR